MPRDLSFVETHPDVFSLDGLIAWLETQPPQKEYCYGDTGGCLLARYLRANGFKRVSIGGWTWAYTTADGCRVDESIPDKFDKIARSKPRTYGAALSRALSRARALKAEADKP